MRFRRNRISVTQVPGGVIIGDLASFGTEERPPTQADLDSLVVGATRVAIREPFKRRTLFETTDAAELASLRDALRIHDGGIGHCMCFGSLELEFSLGRKSRGVVTVHHGVSLRWQPFFENAALADPDVLLDWLSARGVTGPREEYEEDRRDEAKSEWLVERWLAAMPDCVKPLWPPDAFKLEWPEVADALARGYPDPVERARVLMEWLGHGSGIWSGFPSYEQMPEWCLCRMPIEVLVEAAGREPRSEETREGAARLFASWEFVRDRELELRRIPAELKRELLAHALESDDEDKRSRALSAFG
jgi:hypothetical protein